MPADLRAELARALSGGEPAEIRSRAVGCYNGAWGIFFGAVKGGGKPADFETAHAMFSDAVAAFERLGEGVLIARACNGLSLLAGMLGNGEQSKAASRRSVEILEGLRAAGPLEDRDLMFLMKGLRALADNSSHSEERLACAARGMAVLGELAKARNPFGEKETLRFTALFSRAAGGAYSRKKPRTEDDLIAGEKHLRRAIEVFEALGENQASKAKAWRELSRALRARAAMARSAGRSKEAAKFLKDAESAVLTAIGIFDEEGDASQWNHFHLAKILRDGGQSGKALAECIKAVKVLEEGREKFESEDHRINYLTDKLAVYDLGVFLSHELDQAEVGFELSQRCKARSFVERFHERPTSTPKDEGGPFRDSRELSGRLAPGQGLIEYHVGRHAVSIFVLTAEGLTSARVECGREKLELLVGNFQSFIRQAPTEMTLFLGNEALKDLSAILLEPVLDRLAGCRRLYLVPSGQLSYLPFGALPLKAGGRLLDRWELAYLPSAAMLGALKTKARSGAPKLLALANPTLDLWHSEDEARDVAETFSASRVALGEEATKALLKEIDGTTHLHLACHGQYAPDDPLGSRLILAPGAADDGVLGVQEILDLPLKNVELAFLSCCKSAFGHHRGGDEFDGVHRAFLSAGARAVAVALWDIEDAVTRSLVVSFYRHLKNGMRKAQALREAQLEVLKQHPHPFYWAAFKLVGSLG